MELYLTARRNTNALTFKKKSKKTIKKNLPFTPATPRTAHEHPGACSIQFTHTASWAPCKHRTENTQSASELS